MSGLVIISYIGFIVFFVIGSTLVRERLKKIRSGSWSKHEVVFHIKIDKLGAKYILWSLVFLGLGAYTHYLYLLY